jgi:hypothetical protein
MTSPIKKGRWKSVDELMRAIGRVTRRIARLRLSAEELDDKANETEEKEEAGRFAGLGYRTPKSYRIEATEKLDRAGRMESGYLQHLKRKLAVMQTPLLPNVGTTDTSIPK